MKSPQRIRSIQQAQLCTVKGSSQPLDWIIQMLVTLLNKAFQGKRFSFQSTLSKERKKKIEKISDALPSAVLRPPLPLFIPLPPEADWRIDADEEEEGSAQQCV